jgi:hypothetical protein
MTSNLFSVVVMSPYLVSNKPVLLPRRMAVATADMKAAILGLESALNGVGGELVLSDLFRSYDMQYQSHLEWLNKQKTAFSPPPGGSFHEAGRAFDLDLSKIGVSLSELWNLAAPLGLVPIISSPDPKQDEAWHFECRGSHQLVYEHYKAGRGSNFDKPYKAAAASAIIAIGVHVDAFGDGQAVAYLQSGLIRLGYDIGNLDGRAGPRTRRALEQLEADPYDLPAATILINERLQEKFSGEFFDRMPLDARSMLA